jgi:hypothetical protein
VHQVVVVAIQVVAEEVVAAVVDLMADIADNFIKIVVQFFSVYFSIHHI